MDMANHERNDLFPEQFGFRSGLKGTHTSRTIMLAELTALLDARDERTTKEGYRKAILDENVLGKRTAATRGLMAQRLSARFHRVPSGMVAVKAGPQLLPASLNVSAGSPCLSRCGRCVAAMSR